MSDVELAVSAPGRICLLGEHQDYLGLSIIAAAINLRISVSGKRRKDCTFKINLPDIGDIEELSFEKELKYNKERDYLKSSINVLHRKGIKFLSGWDCLIHGNIPINSGTASSSSLTVAWIKFLLEAANDIKAKEKKDIAELSFLAEVDEFKEPGGKMDHYTSSLGDVIFINFGKARKIQKFKNPLKEFVLADSLQKKDTTGMIGYIKHHVLQGVSSIQKKIKDFSLESPLKQEVLDEIEKIPQEEKKLLKGTLLTRDLTQKGKTLFDSEDFDHAQLGCLLSQQHEVLRDYLNVSTPKIEQMIEAALEAGAIGAKINGSGGGGCIFAYTPKEAKKVTEVLKKLGAQTYIIHVDEGVRKDI